MSIIVSFIIRLGGLKSDPIGLCCFIYPWAQKYLSRSVSGAEKRMPRIENKPIIE